MFENPINYILNGSTLNSWEKVNIYATIVFDIIVFCF